MLENLNLNDREENVEIQQQDVELLRLATLPGSDDAILNLIHMGADLNVRDANGNTPAHLAALAENTEVFELLITNFSSVDEKDQLLENNDGETVLDIALRLSNYDLIHDLYYHDLNFLSFENNIEDNLIELRFYAYHQKLDQIIGFLRAFEQENIDANDMINSPDINGKTALSIAIEREFNEIENLLRHPEIVAEYDDPYIMGENFGENFDQNNMMQI